MCPIVVVGAPSHTNPVPIHVGHCEPREQPAPHKFASLRAPGYTWPPITWAHVSRKGRRLSPCQHSQSFPPHCWAAWPLCATWGMMANGLGHANKKRPMKVMFCSISSGLIFQDFRGLCLRGAMRCVRLRTAGLRRGGYALHGAHGLGATQRMGLTHTSAFAAGRSWWVAVAVWRAPWRGPRGACSFDHMALAPSSRSVSWSKLAPTNLRHLTPANDEICKYQLL